MKIKNLFADRRSWVAAVALVLAVGSAPASAGMPFAALEVSPTFRSGYLFDVDPATVDSSDMALWTNAFNALSTPAAQDAALGAVVTLLGALLGSADLGQTISDELADVSLFLLTPAQLGTDASALNNAVVNGGLYTALGLDLYAYIMVSKVPNDLVSAPGGAMNYRFDLFLATDAGEAPDYLGSLELLEDLVELALTFAPLLAGGGSIDPGLLF